MILKNFRPILVFMCCSILTNKLDAQIAYYDALYLNDFVVSGKIVATPPTQKPADFISVLKKYIEPSKRSSIKNSGDLYNYFKENKNPFLINFFNPSTLSTFSDPNIPSATNFDLKSLGGLDVTNIADGLAQFMISRAKDEISVAFIQRFKDQLEKYPEIQVLFPETSDLLENILAYEYTLLLPSLQVAFEKDLKEMYYNVENIFELPDYRKKLEEYPEIGIIIRSMYTISKLEDGAHPSDVLSSLINIDEWDNPELPTELKNLKSVLELGNLFSDNLRFRDTSYVIYSINNINYYQTKDSLCKFETGKDTVKLIEYSNPAWISKKHMDLLIQDSITFKIFCGLIYQQTYYDTIGFTISKSTTDTTIYFHDLLKENAKDIAFLKNQFVKFQTLSSKGDAQIAKIKNLNAKGEKPSKENYYEYIDVSLEIIEYGMESIKYFAKTNNHFMNFKSDKYLQILRDVNEFYKASYTKNYSTMVLYGTNVIEEIYDIYAVYKAKPKLESKVAKFKEKADKENGLEEYYTKKQHKFESPYQKKYKKTVSKQKEDFNNALNTISKYGSFMAQIAQADSGAQVKDIIETFALPAGSSSLKKYQQNNWAINSYIGYSYKSDLSYDHNWKMFAPIGVAYTPLSMKKGGSLSVFISLIDIGAIVDYRLNASNDTIIKIMGTDTTTTITKNIEYSNKIQLGNIISPGGYFVYGFGGNIPLSLGVGAQYGPALTSINNDGIVVKESTWMFNVSLTVDIPIINIHPGKRKRLKY